MILHKVNNLTFRRAMFKKNEEHISFENVVNQLKNDFVECKINNGTDYVIDKSFRKGKQEWSYGYCANFDNKIVEQIHMLHPNWIIHPVRFSLLSYEIGDFFKPHCDHNQGVRESNGKKFKHVATILILPPMYLHEHEGGELILYLNNNIKTIKATNNWTILIFELGIVHAVTELKSGHRYVFKGEIYERIDLFQC